ncbi:MAG: hypothetical protein ACLPQL_12045 [Desulfobaccales bacterium]
MPPQWLFDQAQGRAVPGNHFPLMRLAVFQDVFHPDPINKEIGDDGPFPFRGRFRLLDTRLEVIEKGSKVGFFVSQNPVSQALKCFLDHIDVFPFPCDVTSEFPCIISRKLIQGKKSKNLEGLANPRSAGKVIPGKVNILGISGA